jgi:hypothetical protein
MEQGTAIVAPEGAVSRPSSKATQMRFSEYFSLILFPKI